AGYPIRRTPQVSTPRIDDKDPFGISYHPDAVLVLKLRFDSYTVLRGITDAKDGARFIERARQEKAHKAESDRAQKGHYRRPDQTPTEFEGLRFGFGLDRRFGRRFCGCSRGGFRSGGGLGRNGLVGRRFLRSRLFGRCR